MSPIEIVRAKEEEIRGNRFESAFAVGEAGRVLLDKRGEQFHVGFTQSEIDRLRGGQGVLFTHNHPRGWDYPTESPLHAGSSFSDTDVRFACQVEVSEMRVVTPVQRYFLRPSVGGWTLALWDALLEPSCARHLADVRSEYQGLVIQKRLAPEEAGASRGMHETFGLALPPKWAGLTYGRRTGVTQMPNL